MYNNIKKLVKTRNMYTFCTGHQGLSFCNPATQTSLVLPSNSFYPRGTSIQNNAVQPWEMLFPAIREVKIGAWYRCRHGSPTSSSMLCMRTILPITMVIPWHGKKSGAEICFVCFFFLICSGCLASVIPCFWRPELCTVVVDGINFNAKSVWRQIFLSDSIWTDVIPHECCASLWDLQYSLAYSFCVSMIQCSVCHMHPFKKRVGFFFWQWNL